MFVDAFLYCELLIFSEEKLLQLGQSIQEWTKWDLWKTAFKKFEGIWSA